MNLIRNNIRAHYGQVPNALINDFSISPVARCLFTWMAAQADTFRFRHETMQKAIGASSKKTLAKYVKELIQSGWVSRDEVRIKGVFDGYQYTIYSESTVGQNLPYGKKTATEKNRYGKNDPLNNNKSINKNNTTSTTTREPFLTEDEIDHLDAISASDTHPPGCAAPPAHTLGRPLTDEELRVIAEAGPGPKPQTITELAKQTEQYFLENPQGRERWAMARKNYGATGDQHQDPSPLVADAAAKDGVDYLDKPEKFKKRVLGYLRMAIQNQSQAGFRTMRKTKVNDNPSQYDYSKAGDWRKQYVAQKKARAYADQ